MLHLESTDCCAVSHIVYLEIVVSNVSLSQITTAYYLIVILLFFHSFKGK